MQRTLGCSSLCGQSGDGGTLTALWQLSSSIRSLMEGISRGQPGSLHSFWWPVHGEGAENELGEARGASALSCQFWSASQLPSSSWALPGSGAESSGGGEGRAGQALAGHSWTKPLHQLCPLKSCAQRWGQLSPAGERCFVRVLLEHPPTPRARVPQAAAPGVR